MNERFENQKERLLAIKQEISLLYQQVNYLLRNEKPIELLDLDVLMNRTHTLYDQLCSINVGDDGFDEDLPFDADDLAGLFGGMGQVNQEDKSSDEPIPEEEKVDIEETMPEPEEEQQDNPVVAEPEPESQVVPEEQPMVEVQHDAKPEPEPETEEKPLDDAFGVFFRFEDIPEEEKTHEETIEKEGKLVHVMEAVDEEDIPERDRVHGEDLIIDNPLVMPQMDEERKAEREEIGRQSSEGMTDVFGQDDAGFELSTGETLGEKMMGGEDVSLAAKLQQNPVCRHIHHVHF